jgi:hypothetical protein
MPQEYWTAMAPFINLGVTGASNECIQVLAVNQDLETDFDASGKIGFIRWHTNRHFS